MADKTRTPKTLWHPYLPDERKETPSAVAQKHVDRMPTISFSHVPIGTPHFPAPLPPMFPPLLSPMFFAPFFTTERWLMPPKGFGTTLEGKTEQRHRSFAAEQQQKLKTVSTKRTEIVATTKQLRVNPIVAGVLNGKGWMNQNTCAECGTSFRLTGDLVAHMRSHHRHQGVRANRNHCGTTITTKEINQASKIKSGNPVTDDDSSIICPTCNDEISESQLRKHLLEHENPSQTTVALPQ